jgi:hypothetical protein
MHTKIHGKLHLAYSKPLPVDPAVSILKWTAIAATAAAAAAISVEAPA